MIGVSCSAVLKLAVVKFGWIVASDEEKFLFWFSMPVRVLEDS